MKSLFLFPSWGRVLYFVSQKPLIQESQSYVVGEDFPAHLSLGGKSLYIKISFLGPPYYPELLTCDPLMQIYLPITL